MSKIIETITENLQTFIQKQKIFFVGTAMSDGRVNVSPKGTEGTFYIIDGNQVVWLNLTGSGNETSIHLQHSDRMTVMFCSFEKNPMILRLYGKAKAYHKDEDNYQKFLPLFPGISGVRQIIWMQVDMVQTSCGYAVPFMAYQGERNALELSLQKKEKDGIEAYWQEKNTISIDGVKDSYFKKDNL